MAIQVGGTQVISDTQGLTNIASVDATTAASISAAGVGGGGTHTFTASGTIAAGDVVALNSDGTVSTVSETTIAASQSSLSSSSYPFGSAIKGYYNGIAFDDDIDKFLIASSDQYGSLRLSVGTIGTGNTISFGTTVNPSNAFNVNQIVSIGGGVFVLVGFDPNNSNYVSARVATVSGTSVSVGSTVSVVSQSGNGMISYDADQGKVLVYCQDTVGDPALFVGTVSGSSISFGTGLSISSGSTWTNSASGGAIAYHPVEKKHVVIYENDDDTTGRQQAAVVATISGTSVSIGSATLLGYDNGSGGFPPQMTYDPVNNKLILIVSYGPNYGRAILATVSGTTASFGTPIVFNSANTYNYTTTFDTVANKNIVVYASSGVSNPITWRSGEISGSTIAYSSATNFDYGARTPALAFDPNTQKTVMIQSWGSNIYAACWVFNASYVASDNADWVGIAAEAISDTASGSITLFTGTNDQQTGLTAGTVYYADSTGGLATSGTYKIGKAISTTEITITEGNA